MRDDVTPMFFSFEVDRGNRFQGGLFSRKSNLAKTLEGVPPLKEIRNDEESAIINSVFRLPKRMRANGEVNGAITSAASKYRGFRTYFAKSNENFHAFVAESKNGIKVVGSQGAVKDFVDFLITADPENIW